MGLEGVVLGVGFGRLGLGVGFGGGVVAWALGLGGKTLLVYGAAPDGLGVLCHVFLVVEAGVEVG